MQYYIRMIPASGSAELEEDLNQFLRSHRVVQEQKSLEAVQGAPCWCFCVEWLEGAPVAGGRRAQREAKIDY